jgi:CheY-like chemotaxis protein
MSAKPDARILIVDDQREIARVLRNALELANQGYHVTDVPSGEEALLELGRETFDLIITDYRLPGMSGVELLQRARRRQPDVQAFVITGQTPADVRQALGDLAVAHIFDKPIDTAVLINAVAAILGGQIQPEAALQPEEEADHLPEAGLDEDAIGQLLGRLQAELGPQGIAFASRNGKVIIREGAVSEVPRFRELAVLLANNINTAAEITTYLGEGKTSALQYYAGGWYDLYVLPAGADYFVVIVFPGGSQKQMGPVLRYGQAVVRRIEAVLTGGMQPTEQAHNAAEDTLVYAQADTPAAATPSSMQTAPGTGTDEILPIPGADSPARPLDLDFDDLDLDLAADLGDLDGFWEQAASLETKLSDDALSHEEAIEMGLIPEDPDMRD